MAATNTSARRGRLFVIAAPSGAGKTSLVRALMEREPALRFSISYTTRQQRPTEIHGRDYFFVTKPEFEAMVARGEFLEHARVFDNSYGTARSPVEASLAVGPGPDPGDRLAGRAADPPRAPRMPHDFHPAAVARGARTAPARPGHRCGGRDPAPVAGRRVGHDALVRVRLRRRQRRLRAGARGVARASSTQRGAPLAA